MMPTHNKYMKIKAAKAAQKAAEAAGAETPATVESNIMGIPKQKAKPAMPELAHEDTPMPGFEDYEYGYNEDGDLGFHPRTDRVTPVVPEDSADVVMAYAPTTDFVAELPENLDPANYVAMEDAATGDTVYRHKGDLKEPYERVEDGSVAETFRPKRYRVLEAELASLPKPFRELALENQAKLLRHALKARCSTLSVCMASGAEESAIDISGSEEHDAFSREEAAALKDLGLPVNFLSRKLTIPPEEKAQLYQKASYPPLEAVSSWEETTFSPEMQRKWITATEGKIREPYKLAVRWATHLGNPAEALAWYKTKYSLGKAVDQAIKYKDLPTVEERIKTAKRFDAAQRAMHTYPLD